MVTYSSAPVTLYLQNATCLRQVGKYYPYSTADLFISYQQAGYAGGVQRLIYSSGIGSHLVCLHLGVTSYCH